MHVAEKLWHCAYHLAVAIMCVRAVGSWRRGKLELPVARATLRKGLKGLPMIMRPCKFCVWGHARESKAWMVPSEIAEAFGTWLPRGGPLPFSLRHPADFEVTFTGAVSTRGKRLHTVKVLGQIDGATLVPACGT